MTGTEAGGDEASARLEERYREPARAALVTTVAALPALAVGLGVALALPGTEGLLPVTGPVSWVVSVLATAFVAWLANLVPVLAWVAALAWVRRRTNRSVHDLVATATVPLALGISLGAAVLAADTGQAVGLLVAAALLASVAVAAQRKVPDIGQGDDPMTDAG